MPRPSVLLPVIAAVTLFVGLGVGVTHAAFSKITTNGGNGVTAKRIFPNTTPVRTTSPWVVSDASSGTPADVSQDIAVTGGTTRASGNFASTFSATRYISFAFGAGLPADVPVSGVTFDFNFLPNAGTETGCFYFEVIKTSTGTVLGTHGSSGTPISPCATGTSVTTYSLALSEITTTNQLNDLTIKVYGRESGGKPFKVDLARVSGSYTYGGSFQLFSDDSVNAASGTASSTAPWGPWSLASQDTTLLTNASNWGSTFNASKYVQVTFPTDIPTGAVIQSVTFGNRYKSTGAGKKSCFYYEAWSGGTKLQTYGSTVSASPTYCSPTDGTYGNDSVSMGTDVNTVAKANGLVIKMFGLDTGPVKTTFDQITLTVDYYLD